MRSTQHAAASSRVPAPHATLLCLQPCSHWPPPYHITSLLRDAPLIKRNKETGNPGSSSNLSVTTHAVHPIWPAAAEGNCQNPRTSVRISCPLPIQYLLFEIVLFRARYLDFLVRLEYLRLLQLQKHPSPLLTSPTSLPSRTWRSKGEAQ